MKKALRRFCQQNTLRIYSEIKFWICFHFFRKGLISEEFRGLMGYDINWDDPQDLNEKINWMKLYGDTSEWPRLADKYLVREYVKERIGEKYLTKLYGCWDNADDIDFSSLPEKFVLKTNHGAGTVMPIVDKQKLDITKTKEILKKWMKVRYGYKTIEPHYIKINRKIIAEEFLENDNACSSSLVDYKVYCFNGNPYSILVCTDREIGKHASFSYYDPDWKGKPEVLNGKLSGSHINFPKPDCLAELLECAKALSKGHPQVRVDFYIVNNHPVFGEMTMTSNGGYDNDITHEYSLYLGSKINLK